MRKTFLSFAFGCRVNQAEIEAIDRELISAGFRYSHSNPHFYIINTCAVTAKAEREARQLINRIKRKWPQTKIVITGCSATFWSKKNLKPQGVDFIFDNKHKNQLAKILSQQINVNKTIKTNLPALNNKYIGSGRALIKIQDGCHRFCSYCIVPYLRGLPKSKRIDEVVDEINRLDGKIKEVILTAINTEAYGYDNKESFVDLLRAVINKTKVPRISLGSIHPWSIDENFFRFYEKYLLQGRLVNFFHIPLQSGSNKILKLMKRGYSKEEIMTKLNKIKKINPSCLIATDIIVGFPGEEEEDFAKTYEFLQKTPISKFHVFRFSKREQTAAYFMTRKLTEPSPKKKEARAKSLICLSKKKYLNFLNRLIDQTFPALILEKEEENFHLGILDNQVPIYVKANKSLIGTIRQVRIKELKNDRLFGKIL